MEEDVKQDIQPDAVSSETESETETKVTEQPLTADMIRQWISEATKAVTEQVEAGKREIQSTKDKSKAEVERALREAQAHKEAISSFRDTIKDTDPDAAARLELAELRARDKARENADHAQNISQQQQALLDSFNSGLTEFIKGMGIDVADKRIDWGDDAKTLIEKQQKVLKSVNRIHAENQKGAEDKQKLAFKDMEAKIRKDLGLDSVDISNAAGSTSDNAWLEKWGNGDIDATPQNLKKAKDLMRKLYGS